MSNVLDKIIADKREHIAKRKASIGEAAVIERLEEATPPRGFLNALKAKIAAGENALIAEIKKASPSKGLIREDFSPRDLAIAYEKGGAACLSVLTDEPYFQGRDAYLNEARSVVMLPALRKDFMIDTYQIAESRMIGADCILLIMAALSDSQAKELEAAAHEFGMDVLVEVHDEKEMERALTHLDSRLLGINNRNLKTLEIDLATTERLCKMVPEDYTLVCESGIYSHKDIVRMNKADIHTFLVGESLMKQADVEQAVRDLLNRE